MVNKLRNKTHATNSTTSELIILFESKVRLCELCFGAVDLEKFWRGDMDKDQVNCVLVKIVCFVVSFADDITKNMTRLVSQERGRSRNRRQLYDPRHLYRRCHLFARHIHMQSARYKSLLVKQIGFDCLPYFI